MKPAFQEDQFSPDTPLAIIVEDDRDIVALFRQVLDIAGYRTDIVLDGIEAMKRIETMLPDIVLLDLQLPGMSGVDILKQMKASEALAHIPVIIITAYSQLPQTLTVEPDLLLQKPVDINHLSKLVQRLKATKGGLKQPAHDPVTGLYALSFFLVRLTFALERIKQSEARRFGILFADIAGLEEIGRVVPQDELERFQRHLAGKFKRTLRPTDTMAWSDDDGYFLTLIEELGSGDAPLKIAKRVGDEMKTYTEPRDLQIEVNIGILLCDSGYGDASMIMADLNRARNLQRDKQYTNPAVFDRQMLH
ncbi:MAG: response regulator [Anaerolineales bacterium]|nr:response regulator [Anaerolineales bacterium]